MAIAYLRELPTDVKSDAVTILETLWRRHANGGKGMPVVEFEDEPKPKREKKSKAS